MILHVIVCASVYFPVKIKSMRETVFGLFFYFFHVQKIAFTRTILQLFTGSPNFSRAHFRIFSRTDFFFHGKNIDTFDNFHVWVSFFHAIKKGTKFPKNREGFRNQDDFLDFRYKYFSSIFGVKIWRFFSRTLLTFFTYLI